MIYQQGDFVVVDEWRLGVVDRHFYEGPKRRYVVRYGSDGPHEQVSDTRLRFASAKEVREMEVGREDQL